MKSACLVVIAVIYLVPASVAIWTGLFDRLSQRVDTLAERLGADIDSSLKQTLNPVVEQLSNKAHNVRESLGIWNRPFSPLSSGHPNPVIPPNPNLANQNEGTNPFDLGLSPLFQSFFDNTPQREWWKGPNICIEREEIDEAKKSNSTSPASTQRPAPIQTEGDVTLDEDELPVEDISKIGEADLGTRQSRQFSAHVRMSSCNDEGLSYSCETKIRSNGIRKIYKTRYNCCYGTVREAGEFGCHAVELRSLQETVFALGGRSFLSLMAEAEVDPKFLNQNHTYFVPVDRSSPAASDVANDVNTQNEGLTTDVKQDESIRLRRQATTIMRMDAEPRDMTEVRTVVRGHMVPGIYLTSNFRDEQLLETENSEAKIRINMYNAPARIYTANCVRLVSTNNYAHQGVIHMLDGVMKPATKTIAQLLESEPHFSSFRKLLREQDVAMFSQSGQLTVFAPTDDAFAKLNPELRGRLLKGEGCVHSVVEHHVLPNVICSTVIQGRARSTSLLGSSLLLERDLEGKLYVNGKQVITRDVVASNGVLHVIDGVLIPENARSFSQLLSSHNLTELARLVEAAGMVPMLDSLTNATLFAPNNYAIRSIPDEVKQSWMTNPEKLKQVLMYHLVQPGVRQAGLANNQMVETGLKGQSVRMNFYQSMPFFNAAPLRASVQCGSVLRWEQDACNGNVHIIDRVMIPPENSITQWLANNRSFSIMTTLLKDTKLNEILSAEGTYTVLAPPDVAFYQMPEEVLSEITKDPRKAATILKQHILPEHVCCSGFRGDWFTSNRRRTIDGSWISLQRHLDGSLTAGDSHILSCDQLALNGVIHVVDQVIMPKANALPFLSGTRRLGLPGMELILNHGKQRI
ncbi:hypothetical protein DAPPUDRAFT_302377 [Daphnia pulex]|uniref:FAS1 domain-containing protein n=1 Tax=Daphnia pulex TaxID=6669 RepID=E9GCZ8_DAPPU|nr:hypothetical protein DAPPUDRAFT_302377 [Daphnia pulex]|eukprot:EFX82642.1 hypothetical protein DAPPUDRAFT_302377 [Daphnia pulex]